LAINLFINTDVAKITWRYVPKRVFKCVCLQMNVTGGAQCRGKQIFQKSRSHSEL
jgi:hypothetical protein